MPHVARRRVRPGTDKSQAKVIRDWAQTHGLKVSGRGRISEEVSQAYQDAHQR